MLPRMAMGQKQYQFNSLTPISSMKKLFYIPAVIFGLHTIVSFVAAGYYLFHHQAGEASLAIIFTFTGMIATTWMIALATP